MLPVSHGSLQVAFGLATPSPTANDGAKVKPGREACKVQSSLESSCSHGVGTFSALGSTHNLGPVGKSPCSLPMPVAPNQLQGNVPEK